MSWDKYRFKKGKMSFIAQDFDSNKILAILDGRTQATIRNHFLRYSRQVRNGMKVITMDIFSSYYDIAKKLFPSAKFILDYFHIVQNLGRAMSCLRIQIMNQFDRRSHEYKAIKRYWKLIQQESRKLSHKRFYRQTWKNTIISISSCFLTFRTRRQRIFSNSSKIISRWSTLAFKLSFKSFSRIKSKKKRVTMWLSPEYGFSPTH